MSCVVLHMEIKPITVLGVACSRKYHGSQCQSSLMLSPRSSDFRAKWLTFDPVVSAQVVSEHKMIHLPVYKRLLHFISCMNLTG